jgi:hypothetical protein
MQVASIVLFYLILLGNSHERSFMMQVQPWCQAGGPQPKKSETNWNLDSLNPIFCQSLNQQIVTFRFI